jgi:ribosomal protein S18 acetylase RimI-like enzyme
MNFTFESLLHRPAIELADILTRAFTDYIMSAHFTPEALAYMIRNDSIDLAASRLLLRESKLAGIGLIARRGERSRLAAMGILPEARGQGVGRYLMEKLLAEARERGESAMELEVIEQNTPAVKLYERVGFQKVRRLVGFTAEPNPGMPDSALQEVPLAVVAAEVLAHAVPDLPWQVSGQTLTQWTQPAKGFQLGPAFAALSSPERPSITLQALVVRPEFRRQGHAACLVRALQARFPDKTFRVPIIFPEEFAAPLFTSLDFRPETLSQLQMFQTLS